MNQSPGLKFPVEFPVKIMGRDTHEFHAAVAAILAEHVAPMESLNVTRHASSAGRFVSLTVNFTAQSREQLDALYRALSGNPHVLVAL